MLRNSGRAFPAPGRNHSRANKRGPHLNGRQNDSHDSHAAADALEALNAFVRRVLEVGRSVEGDDEPSLRERVQHRGNRDARRTHPSRNDLLVQISDLRVG